MKSVCGDSTSIICKGLTSVSIREKMDALVSDLTHALDESQLPQYHRKKRGYKRRSKLGNSHSISLSSRMLSDDSSSSIEEVVLSQDNKSSMPLTDSDELTTPPERMRTLNLTRHHISPNLVESDSVNENFSPARLQNRRKQRCKRMAMDHEAPSTSAISIPTHERPYMGTLRKKKVRPSHDKDSKREHYGDVPAGKRKRGRDRSAELEGRRGQSSKHKFHNGKMIHTLSAQMANGECMDLDCNGGSSSESDCGIHTCDEGREADDEQSDWFAEPAGAVYGVAGTNNSAVNQKNVWWQDEQLQLSPSTKAFFKEKYEKMSIESQQACRLRFQKLRERLLRREIRAGRRRLQDRRPGFSIISSVNDKVSRFLQDPAQLELHLRPMGDRDRDQLKHLAQLYSLTLKADGEHASPVLTKTRNTITTQGACALDSFPGSSSVPLNDWKRRKRTPPHVHNLTEGSNDSLESVINNSNEQLDSGSRPPVPHFWADDDQGDNSERLADSEPDPVPSLMSLGLDDCTL